MLLDSSFAVVEDLFVVAVAVVVVLAVVAVHVADLFVVV